MVRTIAGAELCVCSDIQRDLLLGPEPVRPSRRHTVYRSSMAMQSEVQLALYGVPQRMGHYIEVGARCGLTAIVRSVFGLLPNPTMLSSIRRDAMLTNSSRLTKQEVFDQSRFYSVASGHPCCVQTTRNDGTSLETQRPKLPGL